MMLLHFILTLQYIFIVCFCYNYYTLNPITSLLAIIIRSAHTYTRYINFRTEINKTTKNSVEIKLPSQVHNPKESIEYCKSLFGTLASTYEQGCYGNELVQPSDVSAIHCLQWWSHLRYTHNKDELSNMAFNNNQKLHLSKLCFQFQPSTGYCGGAILNTYTQHTLSQHTHTTRSLTNTTPTLCDSHMTLSFSL